MADTVLTPSQAAGELSIKSSTLRKYALAYEKTFGPLPRDAQHNRLYSAMVLQRLSAARTLIEERRAANLEVALQSLNGDMTLQHRSGYEDKLDALAEMVAALHAEIKALRSEERMLVERVSDLQAKLDKALPEPPEPPQATEPSSRPWWRLWGRV